jgi:hypothetical protein
MADINKSEKVREIMRASHNEISNGAIYDLHASKVQARADAAYQAHGLRAPARVHGELLDDFRVRLLQPLVRHSERWRSVDVGTLPEGALAIAEEQIFADAAQAGLDPANVALGTLRELFETDRAGRRISRFIGSPSACWDVFKQPVRSVTRFNTGDR